MESAKIERRERYLLYNLVVWFATFGVAIVVLSGLRHYGTAFAARHNAGVLLDEAEQAYARNDIDTAQGRIAAALRVLPEASSEVLAQFGPRLMLMPSVHDALRQALLSLRREGRLSVVTEARFELLLGDHSRAEVLLTKAVRRDDDPLLHLWLARLRMGEGRLDDARRHFDAYWDKQERGRNATRNGILARYTGKPSEAAYKLLDMGLYSEAVLSAPELPVGPDRAYFNGLGAELKGDREAAEVHYRAVLRERPNHLAALLRLKDVTATTTGINFDGDGTTP